MNTKKHCQNSLAFQINITSHYCKNFAEKTFVNIARCDITFDEYIVLDHLVCYPQIDKSTVANILFFDDNYTEKIINKLEKKKLIRKIKDDKHHVLLKHYELTDNGLKLYNTLSDKSYDIIKILSKFISQNELETFTKTLLKIRNIFISLDNKSNDYYEINEV